MFFVFFLIIRLGSDCMVGREVEDEAGGFDFLDFVRLLLLVGIDIDFLWNGLNGRSCMICAAVRFVYIYVYTSIHPSVQLVMSIYMSMYASAYMSIYMSIYKSISPYLNSIPHYRSPTHQSTYPFSHSPLPHPFQRLSIL